jgi:hypothetical protein
MNRNEQGEKVPESERTKVEPEVKLRLDGEAQARQRCSGSTEKLRLDGDARPLDGEDRVRRGFNFVNGVSECFFY